MKKKRTTEKLTLRPLNYEQAVSAFLKVKPEPKKPTRNRKRQKSS